LGKVVVRSTHVPASAQRGNRMPYGSIRGSCQVTVPVRRWSRFGGFSDTALPKSTSPFGERRPTDDSEGPGDWRDGEVREGRGSRSGQGVGVAVEGAGLDKPRGILWVELPGWTLFGLMNWTIPGILQLSIQFHFCLKLRSLFIALFVPSSNQLIGEVEPKSWRF
jgi:hypothetical protein